MSRNQGFDQAHTIESKRVIVPIFFVGEINSIQSGMQVKQL